VSDIAKSANISKGLMYNYFSSKEALLLAIAQKGFKEITKAFDLDNDGILTENELTHFIRHSFKSFKNNKSFWRLYFMMLLQRDVNEIIQKEFQPLQDRLRDL
jgi:AcrR family transcriptional regulator